ncbi:unnamed protein product [Arctogadus glacialis]
MTHNATKEGDPTLEAVLVSVRQPRPVHHPDSSIVSWATGRAPNRATWCQNTSCGSAEVFHREKSRKGEEWALRVQARPLIRGPALKCRVEGSLLLEALSDNNKLAPAFPPIRLCQTYMLTSANQLSGPGMTLTYHQCVIHHPGTVDAGQPP